MAGFLFKLETTEGVPALVIVPLALSLALPTRLRWSGYRKPRLSGAFEERMMGLEPTTFCMASRRSSQLSYIRARPV
jgi:hypothetical protein